MKCVIFALAALAATCSYTVSAYAITLRYALIVGNNSAVDARGRAMKRLRFAEREAGEMRDALVELARFDASPRRTILLRGATGVDVRSAVARLASQRRADALGLGNVQAVFTFFYSGHGERGHLLFEDGPMTATQLGRIFEQIDADLSIGIFDACNSGSFSEMMRAKGITPTPGVNVLDVLPEEVLNSKGRVWFVSSASDEESFEDSDLGGVFTHFLLEGLREAPANGPGITLHAVWQYARDHTIKHTRQRGRQQTPRRHYSSFTSTGATYFSFPRGRNATLVLGEEVHGRFALTYDQGQLTELFEKKLGTRKRIAVHAGHAWLTRPGAAKAKQSRLVIKPGATVVIASSSETAALAGLGRRQTELWGKGAVLDGDGGTQRLFVTSYRRATTWRLILRYGMQAHGQNVLAPRNSILAGARFDYGPWNLHVAADYGRRNQAYDAWGYRLDTLRGEIGGGYGIGVLGSLLDVGPLLRMGLCRQRFHGGKGRTTHPFEVGAHVTITALRSSVRHIQLSLQGGLGLSAGSGEGQHPAWGPWVGLQIGVAWGGAI